MYFIAALALLLFLVFLIFFGRQSTSVQRSRKLQRGIWQDSGSELSILSTAPPQDITHTNATHEMSYYDASVGNYATDNIVDSGVSVSSVDYGTSYDSGGGALGSALGDAIDGGGSSFGGFDSGSDFGGGGDFSGGTDFGGGSTTDGSSS
jgi:hypothetical protein